MANPYSSGEELQNHSEKGSAHREERTFGLFLQSTTVSMIQSPFKKIIRSIMVTSELAVTGYYRPTVLEA